MTSTPTKKQLSVVKKQRTVQRTNVTKELSKLEQYVTVDSKNWEEVKVLVAKLEQAKTVLIEKDEILQQNLQESELNTDIEDSCEYMGNIVEGITVLQSRLEVYEKMKNVEKQKTVTVDQNEGDDGSGYTGNMKSNNKLPKLQLMKFNGDPLHWEEFWDDFTSSVDSRENIPIIKKFKHLKSSLEGEALGVVEGYKLTIANYNEVKEDLKERYGDPEVAIFAHLEALLAIPAASHDLVKLGKVRDACEMHIRSLVALGLTEETFGLVFTPILLSKLPRFVKMELHRKNGSQKWTLSTLRTLLKEEIKARDKSERCFMSQRSDEQSSWDKNDKKQNQSRKQTNFKRTERTQSTSSALISSNYRATNGTEKKAVCAYCSQPHFSNQCLKFPTAAKRMEQLKGKCYCCLKDNHQKQACKSKEKSCYYCKKPGHHSSLCYEKFGGPSGSKGNKNDTNIFTTSQQNPDAAEFKTVNQSSVMSATEKADLKNGRISRPGVPIMETQLANVSGKLNQKCRARFVFDTGSTRSYICTNLAQRVGAECIGVETTSLGRFKENERVDVCYNVYNVKVELRDGTTKELSLSGVDVVSAPIMLYPLKDLENFPLKDDFIFSENILATPKSVTIDILIGLDYYYDIVGDEKIRFSSGLVLVSTSLGYMATGFLKEMTGTKKETSMFISSNQHDLGNNFDFEKYWALENIGIKDDPGQNDDEQAVKYFNETVKFDDGRYQVKWPFKDRSIELPDNYLLSLGRLKSLIRRFKNNPEIMEKYNQTIKDQLNKQVIEEAPEKKERLVHYIPHHGVLTPQKTTTKLRVVYDASAKTRKNGLSLNECLLRGPVMLADLCGLLLRFRMHKIIMISDIEKAFLQVGLQSEDRDVTRFLWLKDINKPVTDDNIITYRFKRVAFGFISSPFLLAATVAYHLKATGSAVALDILSNVYVDNVLGGAESVEEAYSYYKQAKSMFNGASMNLREWFSNCPEFIEKIQESDRGSGQHTNVFGIKWNIQQDILQCKDQNESCVYLNTKRGILKRLASIYDPCGWFSPITINGKILMQEIWKDKHPWDQMLPTELQKSWEECKGDLSKINEIAICRKLDFPDNINGTTCELHVFCDASNKAYGASVYIRMIGGNQIQSDLLFSKARVSPIKQMTIPRLELLAVVIGVRILTFVNNEIRLPIARRYLWSDSKCVLSWIKREQVSTVFVQNRIKEIKSHDGINFRHVSSIDNTADLLSRGCMVEELKQNSLWWHGPDWLRFTEDQWPMKKESDVKENQETEVLKNQSTTILSINQIASDKFAIDLVRFGSLMKLLRVTCYVNRFKNKLQGKKNSFNENLDAVEIHSAKRNWERLIQQRYFSEIFEELTSKADSKNKKDLSYKLNLFVDSEGLIRCEGRLGLSAGKETLNYPKLLPKNSRFTTLVIQSYHKKLFHAGVKHTLAEFRSEYWVLHSRSQVKKVILECRLCRRHDGGPFKIPKTPQLPEFRVSMQRPFACVGIDYLGPLFVCDDEKTKKVWLCIFTCTSVRAIHLEVVADLTCDQFLMCLQRFISLHGKPRLIISDNGKQFHAAENVLKEIWNRMLKSPKVQNFAANQEIIWKFIVELAPWMGGFYERLIGPVKKAIKRSTCPRLLKLVELQTVTYEVAAMINSRPLLYNDCEPEGIILTPAHFLLKGHDADMFTDSECLENYLQQKPSTERLIKHWKRIQNILNEFWNMWSKHYLLSLRESYVNKADRNAVELEPKVGTVVQIKEEGQPRCKWRIGKISRINKGGDNLCRSVVVTLANKRSLVRPIKLLYPLEVSVEEKMIESQNLNASNKTLEVLANSRPKRKAARQAEHKIAEYFQEEDVDNQ